MENRNRFKCLIEYNSCKYCVIIDNNTENKISFDSVLSQIKIITNNESISLESHSFEIFDNDFNEYVFIPNNNEIIENLSKIRVKSKFISKTASKLETNDMEMNPINESVKSVTIESDSGTNTLGIKPNSVINCVNYFGPNILKSQSYKNPNSPELCFNICLEEMFICLKFKTEDMIAYKHLLQHLLINKHLFTTDSIRTDCRSNSWLIISNCMKYKAFYKWSPQKCMESFIVSVKLYIQILENADNYEIANKVYPLFGLIHSSDLYCLVKSIVYQQIVGLKKQFNNKTCNGLKSDSNILLNNKPKQDSKPENNNNNNMKILKNANKISQKSKTSPQSYFDTKVLTQLRGPKQPSLDFKHKMEIFENENICVLDFSPQEVNAYKLLLQMMDNRDFRNTSKLMVNSDSFNGSTNCLHYFWKPLSDVLINFGFINWNPQKCYQCFIESIQHYRTVLIKAPNILIASRVFPLFNIINSFDLKHFIKSYNYTEIQKLKTKFSAKPENLANVSSKTSVESAEQSGEKSQNSQMIIHLYFNSKILTKNREQNSSSLNYEIKVETIENQLIYVLKFNENNFNAFKQLLQSMTQNKHLFINNSEIDLYSNNLNNFWKQISEELITYNWDQKLCYESFIESVDIYIQVLCNAPNCLIASKVYPLFNIISIFDLKPFLITDVYEELIKSKSSFDIKSGKTSKGNSSEKLNDNNVINNEITQSEDVSDMKSGSQELKTEPVIEQNSELNSEE